MRGEPGRYDKAIADYDEAIRLNPNDASAYYERGQAWHSKDDLDKAIADYDEAIRLDPRHARAYTIRGIVLQSEEKEISNSRRTIWSRYDV